MNSLITLALLLPTLSSADPSPAKTYSDPKSKCVVKSSAGEYPFYTVHRGKKVIFRPGSDGIWGVSFSPSGKYIALMSGEMDGIRIGKAKAQYSMVIVSCESGKAKGYVEWGCAQPSDPKVCIGAYPEIKSWAKDEKSLSYELVSNEKRENRVLDFAKNPLP
jgi:hypothetical protein